jgi:hypothetical protein
MLAPGIQSSAPHQSDRPPLSSAQGACLECCRSHQFRRIRIGQLAKTPDCPGRQLKQETKPGSNQERYIHIIQEISKSFGVQLKNYSLSTECFLYFQHNIIIGSIRERYYICVWYYQRYIFLILSKKGHVISYYYITQLTSDKMRLR